MSRKNTRSRIIQHKQQEQKKKQQQQEQKKRSKHKKARGRPLKVHKREKFFVSDFEFFTIL
jgi:hypothetical protein